eukprot:SAG31_NODE_523_length_14545_cov_4.805067_2_plen_314_part_00
MVGAAGYLVQAYTARRAEKAAAVAAQEQRTADTTKERLHQQMAAQIRRIDRVLDQCCRPMGLGLHNIHYAILLFIDAAVAELESTQIEVAAHMIEQAKATAIITDNGKKAVEARTGWIIWDATAQSADLNLVRIEKCHTHAFCSAAGAAVSFASAMAITSQPFATEIPQALADYIAAEPTSKLAHRYRFFVRHCLVPCMHDVGRLLQAHGALVELPPIEWLKEKFPIEGWQFLSPSTYFTLWLVRTQQWEVLLREWDSGDMSKVLPWKSAMYLRGGMRAMNNWAIARGESRQRELIGCRPRMFAFFLAVRNVY